MTDIVVKVPKSEEAHFWEEHDPDSDEWWTLASKPKHCQEGDFIWFELQGQIVAKAQIEWIDTKSRHCDATDREWKGVHVGWSSSKFIKLDSPKEGVGVWRGFRYYEP